MNSQGNMAEEAVEIIEEIIFEKNPEVGVTEYISTTREIKF